MKVTIRNIAKIRTAEIVCQGITAIIGDNNRGKSTIGKVLYSVFHSFRDVEDGLHEAKVSFVMKYAGLRWTSMALRILRMRFFDRSSSLDENELRIHLRENWRFIFRQPFSAISRVSSDARREQMEEMIAKIIEAIKKVREIPDSSLFHDVITNDLNRYFHNQFLPNYSGFNEDSRIELSIKGRLNAFHWGEGGGSADVGISLLNRAWFVGTPLVLDALGVRRASDIIFRRPSMVDPINNDLVERLRRYRSVSGIARRVVDKEMEPIYNQIKEFLESDFEPGEDGELGIREQGMLKPLNVSNLSMGIKMLALIKLMLEANILNRKDVLVLDEPENHLHPELQTVFADVIVMLQRIYDLTVLVTTHSPYFLQALELSVRRYRAEDKSGAVLNVYQPKVADDLGRVDFDDITGKTSDMYRRFAQTMRNLDFERMRVREMEEASTRGAND